MVTASWFLNAAEARNNIVKDIAVHGEISEIEHQVLLAAQRGDYEIIVDNTLMTAVGTAAPEVFNVDADSSILTVNSHGLVTGDIVTITSTGLLPPPLLAGCPYYVIVIDPNHIMLASTRAQALSGQGLSIDISEGVINVIMISPGSGYLTAPRANPTGGGFQTTAVLTAILSHAGSVHSISLLTNGSGFTDVPSVSIQALGTGAETGESNFTVVSATVNSGGNNYNVGDLVFVFTGGFYEQAILRVNSTNGGSVTQLGIVSGGRYATVPTLIGSITTTSSNGSGCTVDLSMGIYSIEISNQGINYVNSPIVTITDGGGSGAKAVPILSGGGISSLLVTSRGSGYTTQPTVVIDSGQEASALVQLSPSMVVDAIITDPGSEYSYVPNIGFSSVGTGASIDQTFLKVVNVVLSNPGVQYVAGDIIQISGGVATLSCTIEIVEVSDAGNISSWVILNGGNYSDLPILESNNVIGGSGVGASFDLHMGLSSITLDQSGSNYVVPPLVIIDNSYGSGAAAYATLSGDQVVDIIVTSPGTGYTVIPSVILTTGDGAVGEAHLSPTVVDFIQINDGGSGYQETPVVTISGGGGQGAQAEAILDGDTVIDIVVTNPGSGYTSVPQLSIEGNAQATLYILPTSLGSITITDGGQNYVINPTVIIYGGNASARSVLASTSIQAIFVDNPGFNYITDPVLNWEPGNAQVGDWTQPITRVNRSFGVDRVDVASPGSGYVAVPDIVFSAPSTGGITASATAVIGSGSGIFSLTLYSASRDYFLVWKDLLPSNNLVIRPYYDQMNAVIKYFTDLGYTITREVNPASNNTFQWHLYW